MRAFLSILGMMNHYPNVMDDFKVPQGIDRETAINKIMFDCAELGLIYTDPNIFPVLVKNWTNVNLPNWEKAMEALLSNYNPIHNYDKTDDWEEWGDGTGNGTTDRDVAGFNQNNSLVKEGKNTSEDSYNNHAKHQGRIFGNIGVKTTQSMIAEEMELRVQYNIYQMISDSFKSNFCVRVY